MGEFDSKQMTDDYMEFEMNGHGREIMIKGPSGKLHIAEVQV